MDKYHDVAVACTHQLFDFVRGLLPTTEEEDVFLGMYARVKAALEIQDLQEANGVQQRLEPTSN